MKFCFYKIVCKTIKSLKKVGKQCTYAYMYGCVCVCLSACLYACISPVNYTESVNFQSNR